MTVSAVLLLVFNRPDTTSQVFEAVRLARPPRLYVAADGARPSRPQETAACEEVRRIATAVDWPCEVRTLFRDNNLGCRRAVSNALDWFFAHEESGIVLEDDCLPAPEWFRFADEMLERFSDDTRVMCIAGTHFHGAAHLPNHSYFFSRYNHCWGWASWRRAWKNYDRDMSAWPNLRDTPWLLSVGDGSASFRRYWTEIFDIAYEGKRVDSWAYRWTFSCWSQSGLTILPAANLISNVGFGDAATHTGSSVNALADMPLGTLAFPLIHPSEVVRDVQADRWSDRNVFGISAAAQARDLFKKRVRALPILGLLAARTRSFLASRSN